MILTVGLVFGPTVVRKSGEQTGMMVQMMLTKTVQLIDTMILNCTSLFGDNPYDTITGAPPVRCFAHSTYYHN